MRIHCRNTALLCVVGCLALLSVLLSACGALATSAAPTATSVPPTATPEPGTFYLTTEDGVSLIGQTYGQGTTAIVLSCMDADDRSEWQPLAELLAGRGYLVVTYNYRGIDPSQGFYARNELDRDLRAATKAAHTRGATKVVLMGASLGGLVTLKGAATEHPVAAVILSAPTAYGGLSVSLDELHAITAPKFFVVGRKDSGFYVAAQELYDDTPEPKLLQVYPNNYHGTAFFEGSETKDDFLARLVTFLQANAPA